MKTYHFLIILPHFTIISALEVIFVYIHMVEIPYNGVLLCISSQLRVQGCHTNSLQSNNVVDLHHRNHQML